MPAYEISNHARPGQESRHNLTYWRYGDYAGVGPGAHGRRLGMRTVRHRKPENFLSGAARNGHGIVEEAISQPAKRPTKRWSWACGLPKASTPTRSPQRFGTASDRRLATGRPAGRVRPSDARRRPHRADAAGRLLLDHILARDRRRPAYFGFGGWRRLRRGSRCRRGGVRLCGAFVLAMNL